MPTAKKKNIDSCEEENEKSPSPEPFQEPDGMVTIELNRHSPSPPPLSAIDTFKDGKKSGVKYLSYLLLIAILCLVSFSAAVFIHWDDIRWITEKLTKMDKNQTSPSVPTPSPLLVPSTTHFIDMETCPADPQERYRIHLIICERTKTFEDCCHSHLRSMIPQINDVCSVLELLNSLVEYRRIFSQRTERDVDSEYTKDDFKNEKDKKEREKTKTREKLLSYIRHLNKPLQREIPALFDWFGDLFLEYQNEFENNNMKDEHEYKSQQPQSNKPNVHYYESPSEQSIILERKSPGNKKPDVENQSEKISSDTKKPSNFKEIYTDSQQKLYNETVKGNGVNEGKDRGQNQPEIIEKKSEQIDYVGISSKPSSFSRQDLPSNDNNLVMIESLLPATTQKIFLEEREASSSKIKKEEGYIRRKRDETSDPYPIEERGYQPFEIYENNGFPDQTYDSNFNPANMQINNMDPMVNDQIFNSPAEEYPPVGNPALYPQQTQDDTPEYTGYHSLIDERQREELRLPIHTEERDFARQTWKDMNIYGLNQDFNAPKDRPSQDFMMNNGAVTYTYLDSKYSVLKTTTEIQQQEKTTPYANNYKHFPRPTSLIRNNHGTVNRINDRKMKFPPEDISTITPINTVAAALVDAVEATDSIESIENIRGTNESVLVEIGKTKISISKASKKPETTERIDDEVDSTDNNVAEISTEKIKETRGDVIKGPNSENTGIFDNSKRAAQQNKGNTFQLMNEDSQSSQNLLVGPNMCQYSPSLGSPNRFIMGTDNHPQIISVLPPSNVPKPPVFVLNPSVYSFVPPSPVIPHYGPITQQYNPYAYINTLSAQPVPPVATGQIQVANMPTGSIQVANTNGNMYVCNPAVPATNVQPSNTQALEIRSSSNLQESFDRTPLEIPTSNKTRASLNCPMNEQSCLDGSKCISIRHVCDNEVHCEDGSDETFCSCRERIAEIRLCDGYFDCPDGEDERGCFGCSEDEINCDDWSRFRKGTCIPINQRCDGIRQCEVTGKDEDDCSILTDHIIERNPMKISNSAGFLHRNYKGKWYPTCVGSEVWALDVCKIEAGPSTIAPLSHLVLTTEKYEGEYINLLPNREVSFVKTCVQDRAAFVECPPLFCGLRMTIRNPYRSQEVDTSIEDMMNHLNRQDFLFGDDLELSRMGEESYNRTKRSEDFILGDQRVVGGRASQPAAWPWVVSIYKNGIFHCGGVIINELWILTAAHCVDKYWLFYYEIQAGILRRFSYSPMEQIRWVVAAIAHGAYDKSNLKNDIALMRLSSSVRYNRYIRPICLPSEATAGKDFLRGPSPGTICTTVGWGATVEHGTDPDHMREVEVPILKNCKHQEDIEGQEICAGLFEGGKDACQGDSGGPFMCQNPNNPSQWYLAGIVSHGEGCARPNEPGVYTRVSQYIEWIADNMRDENFMSRMPLQKCPGYICRGTNKCIPKKRHCDKIVDCLMGDDEMNCGTTFHNIFKFSGASFMPFFRTTNAFKTKSSVENAGDNDDIVGASIINSDLENTTLTPILPYVKPEEEVNVSRVIYHYEKKVYFTNNTKNADYFRCNKLLQMIPIHKRCNKEVDCEDGTDEEDCKCVDYIKVTHPNAICDGVMDCNDSTDESFCFSCEEGEFNCRKSRMCVSSNLICDGKRDCTKGEDELDCIALTDGKSLILDNTLRPNMSLAGIVSINHFGLWRPYCNTSQSKADASVATNICNYLGFGEYTGFKKIKLNNRLLTIKNMSSLNRTELNTGNDSTICNGLYVWCSDVNMDSALERVQDLNGNLKEKFEATWNAVIFSDGVYKCMGVILNKKWVLTSLYCFDGILHYSFKYLTVVVGKGARYLDVPGPHDRILNVAEAYRVGETDIAVLRLEKFATFNRYIQPTYLNLRIDKMRKEKCVAIGLKDGKATSVFLETKSECSKDENCFSAALNDSCLDIPWNGVITCNAGNGWYPASVFNSNGKACPFKEDANFTSVRYWAKTIEQFSDNMKSVMQEGFCNGFRCDLGNCIDAEMLCDGLPQCMYGEDETPYYCEKRKNACPILKNCVCPTDHLTCLNGNCVHKSKFCDRINDCGDYSDEPPRCTCRSFMKLTHPEKICDGHLNCLDNSDEDPRMCQCQSGDFMCGRSNLCVSNEMICNGIKDCPNGEDEKQCYAFAFNISNTANSGEVLTKTAGHLFQSCYLDSPSQSALDNICQHLGFNSSTAFHLEPYLDKDNAILVPVIDTFNVVWIRREGKVPLLFRTRTGNDAYLTFRKQNNCRRLHIECT